MREYWILDLEARILILYARTGKAPGFDRRVRIALKGRTPVSVLPGLSIDWGEVFAG